jgi:CheY-like chemotaxis protein/two-component sensor histidine kinase
VQLPSLEPWLLRNFPQLEPTFADPAAMAAIGLAGALLGTGLLVALRTRALHRACARLESEGEQRAELGVALRSSLSSVLDAARLLADDATDADVRERLVDGIDHLVRSLGREASELFDLKAVTESGSDRAVEPTDLRTLVEGLAQRMRPRAEVRGVRLEIQISSELPECVGVQATIVEHVLGELVENALEVTEHGHVTVTLGFDSERQQLRAHVVDTGPGLPRRHDPFGTKGAGLAGVKQSLELAGGSITYRSRSNVGTEFRFSLPALALSETIAPAMQSSTAQLAEPADTPSAHVLIVGTRHDGRQSFAEQLGAHGVRVDFAGDAPGGLIAVLRERDSLDLILVDVADPELSGHLLVTDLQTRGLAIPTLALSTTGSAEDRQRALEAGFSDFVLEPLGASQLVERLAELDRSAA